MEYLGSMDSVDFTYLNSSLRPITHSEPPPPLPPSFIVEICPREVSRTEYLLNGETVFNRDSGEVAGPPFTIPLTAALLFYCPPSACFYFLRHHIASVMNLDSYSVRQPASTIAAAVTRLVRTSGAEHGFRMVVDLEFVRERLVFLSTEDDGAGVQASDSGAPSAATTTAEKLMTKRFILGRDEDRDSSREPISTTSDTCSVCLDKFSAKPEAALIPLPCSHVFHEECIFRWVEKRTTCPLCRLQL